MPSGEMIFRCVHNIDLTAPCKWCEEEDDYDEWLGYLLASDVNLNSPFDTVEEDRGER